ncbi:MAG: chemotaxis protein CheR [SAR86 cluster bacterium]|uniref:Chemotaxis protein methyltransferase n=1 Tax=SAR86 cluster bacterium TaxID=2030880 RepID=A0A2A5AXI5_9GAMM|nr:MAG: chemotaxis protein CheR [SAR86 cluster bacterium]
MQQANKLSQNSREQTFEFTETDFKSLREMVLTHTGITLAEHKRDLVYGRLAKRLRALGLTRFCDYCDLLKNDKNNEIEQFTNAITTNLTSFFREKHHFEHLAKDIVPALMDSYRVNNRIRIWSAGCSTGEEAYSIAITLRESIPDIDRRDIRILATDLDSDVIQTGSSGVYSKTRIEALDSERKKRWFKQGSGEQKGKVQVSPELRKLVTFKQLNLMHEWPMRGKFDVVFCRNVVIYFDKPTQKPLFERFANIMRPESTLFIGHSETLNNVSDRFELTGKTVYKKIR